MRLVNNLSDDLAFERIVNVPKRGIGKSTISKISISARLNNSSMFDAAKKVIFTNNSKAKNELYNFIDNVNKWKKIKKILITLNLQKL